MRNGVSSAVLITAAAAFVAVFSNAAFFADVVRVYGLSLKSAPFIASLFCFITSLFVLVLSAVCHRGLVKPMLIAFLLLSSVIAYFANAYGTIFDYRMIGNIVETNTSEAHDLFSTSLVLHVALLGVLPSCVIYAVRVRRSEWKIETVSRLKLVGAAAAMQAAIIAGFSGNYAALGREHSIVLAKVNPTYALFSAGKFVVRSSPAASRPHVAIGTDAKIPPTDTSRELVIMVVGETARADRFSLNGYGRPTNPLLARENVINFPNFWACGTSTSVSVPCMFSRRGRSGAGSASSRTEDNALDILRRAGVSILWRDNNSDSKGVAVRGAYEDFRTPAMNPVCDEVECRDEGMLHGLQRYIDAQKGDILIVLHQMGNHGPAYYKRYPKAFEHFTPACKTNDLGACTSEEINNAYDNAIRYTDYFLAKVIELLKANDDRFETAMLYVSDHGESLGEYGVYLHGMPYALAPESQKHVPAIMWIGQHMKRDLRLDSIDERRLRRWSHDNIFSTLLGLFEIESEVYDPSKDLFEHTTIAAASRSHP